MNRPYLVFRNGMLYRRRKTLGFAMKDVRELRSLGFTASYAEDLGVNQ